jgi:exodeoxyribonuclease VII small subunit
MPRVSKAKAAEEATNENLAAVDFESGLAELETLVQAMEAGDMSLEDSLKAFERGMALSGSCQKALSAAELKIQTLSERAELAAQE